MQDVSWQLQMIVMTYDREVSIGPYPAHGEMKGVNYLLLVEGISPNFKGDSRSKKICARTAALNSNDR
jgi:hypothetical protein